MIVDLHAHYPMHLVPQGPGALDLLTTSAGRMRLRDRLRARLVGLASRFANYRSWIEPEPRVTVPQMREGGVGVGLSVLYSFFDELDLDEPYGARPEPEYIENLIRQLDMVEADIAGNHAGVATVARGPAELDAALAGGEVALVHCVEGGFHLGHTAEAVERGVERLARRGVAYVILAHLFYRGVATNANALPFLRDRVYRLLFPQPSEGLSELGRAAVTTMVRERMLIDISHMSRRAFTETLDLLDRLDPDGHVPVLASHSAFRFGGQEYGLNPPMLRRIADRGGVVGLIFARHQLLDGLGRLKATKFEESLVVLRRHIDAIAEATGSHRHTAIGTDFDGFIKPTLGDLESAANLGRLELALHESYGPVDAEAICSGNALRLLRSYWGGA